MKNSLASDLSIAALLSMDSSFAWPADSSGLSDEIEAHSRALAVARGPSLRAYDVETCTSGRIGQLVEGVEVREQGDGSFKELGSADLAVAFVGGHDELAAGPENSGHLREGVTEEPAGEVDE